VASTVEEYMADRRRECDEMSLYPHQASVYAVDASSSGRRGRIILRLNMTERAFMEVHELVECQGNHVHRLNYGYYLVIDGQEYWARDFDDIHGYHGHTLDHKRVAAGRVTFKEAVEMAWEIVSQEEELTGSEHDLSGIDET
jgi:hypothetical protein